MVDPLMFPVTVNDVSVPTLVMLRCALVVTVSADVVEPAVIA